MSCRFFALHRSRFNTFLAAPDNIILICFHRQSSTDAVLFGFQSHFTVSGEEWRPSLSPGGHTRGGKQGWRLFLVSHVLSPTKYLGLRVSDGTFWCTVQTQEINRLGIRDTDPTFKEKTEESLFPNTSLSIASSFTCCRHAPLEQSQHHHIWTISGCRSLNIIVILPTDSFPNASIIPVTSNTCSSSI